MAETDAENRFAAGLQNPTQIGNGAVALGRIARPVADEEPVVFFRVDGVVPRHHVHARPASQKAAQLVIFQSAIDGADAGASAGVVRLRFLHQTFKTNDHINHHNNVIQCLIIVDYLDGNFLDQVAVVGIVPHGDLGGHIVSDEYLAQHGALLADDLGQLTGIDALDARNSLPDHPALQRLHLTPVARCLAQLRNYQSCRPYTT